MLLGLSLKVVALLQACAAVKLSEMVGFNLALLDT